jgi:cysteine desulfurase
VVQLDALAAALARAEGRALVCLMLANNETGVIQPVAEAARIAHDHGALIFSDAVQAAGRMALSFAALGVDAMSVSAHKLGGPQGVGALALRVGLDVTPLIAGAQEFGRRGGTENLAGIAGFGAAARAAMDELDRVGEIAAWRDDFEADLRRIAPDLCVFGAGAARLGNTSCFAAPGLDAERQVIALDLAGIAIGAGAACSSGRLGVSPVLRAMGVPEALARCAIRVSLGWNSRPEDLARCRDAWAALHARVGSGARERNIALAGA